MTDSPFCTARCTWPALNDARRDPEVVRREGVQAMVHLRFVVTLYREQVENGRYLSREHPQWATSLSTEPIKVLLEDERAGRV